MKLALDSNLFIDAFRSIEAEAGLSSFHIRFAPLEWLSAVVALELRAGTRTPRDAARLERHVLRPFEARRRVFAPSYAAFKEAGGAIAALAAGQGLRVSEMSRPFYNDVLLAASCREHGVTLVTRNARDFERIRGVLAFAFVSAWPE